MKRKLLFALIACFAISSAAQAAKPIKLFNGKNLDGWQYFTKDASLDAKKEYVVKDGVIYLSGKFGYIYTDKVYSDYKLNVEWRWVEKATNSGIFVNMQGENKAWPYSYEVQLCTGKVGDLINSGGAHSNGYPAGGKKIVAPSANPKCEKPVGKWNKAEIICQGDKVTVYINGEKQNELTGLSTTKGNIGLQSEGEAIEFRNVVLTPLK